MKAYLPDQIEILESLQRFAFQYFWNEMNPENGLVADSTWQGAPSSIAAVGFALPSYAVAIERGFISRLDGVERVLTTLRFFKDSPQGPEPEATGYRGFYYHFLDMQSGQRAWECELSTIDTTILLAGILTVAAYFDQEGSGEREIRELANELYQRADWQWALDNQTTVIHGWKPESGFLPYFWQGYDEALMLYVLGLGSALHPLPRESYAAWTSTFRWEKYYGIEYLHASPLFIHQFSHIWLDFRGLKDAYTRSKGIDYFENSRRATYIQQNHGLQNPGNFQGYGENGWGITASEGPGDTVQPVRQGECEFFGYLARGVPGPDDGTLSPWVVISSLPFAPEIVLPGIQYYQATYPQLMGKYGFMCSLNPTFRDGEKYPDGWFSNNFYGLNEGPIILMIENFRSELIWKLSQRCTPIVAGLRRAGFSGGWLT